jgi:hypothetical protein
MKYLANYVVSRLETIHDACPSKLMHNCGYGCYLNMAIEAREDLYIRVFCEGPMTILLLWGARL